MPSRFRIACCWLAVASASAGAAEKLTGDWLGHRETLAEQCGIALDLSTTHFYQGVAAGGLSGGFRYGGRNDCFVTLDAEKLGLWEGLSVALHAESRYGESADPLGGTLSRVNEYLAVPRPTGFVTALTGVKFTQQVSENLQIYAGKINTFDEIRQPLTGASGLEGFLNTSLFYNTIDDRTVPYSTFGAGFVFSKDGEELFSVAVYDTNDTPASGGFDTFFDNGVTILGHLGLPTRLFGLPGHQGISGVYSSGRYTNVQTTTYLNPVGELVERVTTRTGSWFVAYNFDQALYASPGDPARVWGVFGDFGIADDNPNQIHWYAAGGVSGASPIRVRPLDTFGVGFFHLGVSNPLKRSARPDSPLRNEQGVELYYNAALTPWCHVTPDFQILYPFQRRADPALLFGLRAKIDF